MTRFQQEIYNRIWKEESNRIHLSTLPKNGTSIILLNYIHTYLKKNPSHNILICCTPSKVKKWKRILSFTFSSFSCKEPDQHRSHRFMIYSPLAKTKDYDLVICSYRYSVMDIRVPETTKIIFSNFEEQKSGHITLQKRAIIPFNSCYNRLVIKNTLKEVIDKVFEFHHKITLLGASIKLSNNYVVFNGSRKEDIKAFQNISSDQKAILFYDDKTLYSSLPYISDVVILTHFQLMSGYINDYCQAKIFHSLLVSYPKYVYYHDAPSSNHINYNKKVATLSILLIEIKYRLKALGILSDEMFYDLFTDMASKLVNSVNVHLQWIDDVDTNTLQWKSKDHFQTFYDMFEKENKEYLTKAHLLLNTDHIDSIK